MLQSKNSCAVHPRGEVKVKAKIEAERWEAKAEAKVKAEVWGQNELEELG